MPQLEVLLRGVFDKRRFLDLIRHFIVFERRRPSRLVLSASSHM
jgi:type I restriction enzyme, R subunit